MRLPRKLKKKAKKRKAINDAMVMTQTAMLAVMGRHQCATEEIHTFCNGLVTRIYLPK
jgi:hypothetical protein